VIAYLPQHLLTNDSRTVFEEAAQAFAHVFEMQHEIEALNEQLSTRTDYESAGYYEIIEQVSALSEKFYSIDEINYDAEVEKILLGLGFVRDDFNRPTGEFSGGWACVSNWPKSFCRNPTCSCSTSLPTTWILNPYNGSRIS